MDSIISKDDLMNIATSFSKKALKNNIVGQITEYESSTFRQPELYGLPVFVIGYGGRTISYVGQYIAHKIVRVWVGGRIETRWKILTGFVRVLAQHKENKNVIIEVFANGIPSIGTAEYLRNRDQYILIEDRKEEQEIECREDDIINLTGVMKYEDPVILIDRTGTLRELPPDIFAKYSELLMLYEALQRQIFEQEQIMTEMRTEIEVTKAENRKLVNLYNNLLLRLQATAGTLEHYKYEMLKAKEIMNFLEKRLEAVKEGKAKIQAVMSDFYEVNEILSRMVNELGEKIEQVERVKELVESAMREPMIPTKVEKKKNENGGEE